jgi:hypothetical protein
MSGKTGRKNRTKVAGEERTYTVVTGTSNGGTREITLKYVSRGCKTARLDWELYDRLKGEGHTMAYIAERLGVARSTLFVVVKARSAEMDAALDATPVVE